MELLAYLVDRDGVECSTQEIMAVLFEDDDKRRYYNYLRNDLIKRFEELDLCDCLVMNRNGLGIAKDKVDCDYYDFLDGKIKQPPTEYMTQFSFAEDDLKTLQIRPFCFSWVRVHVINAISRLLHVSPCYISRWLY